MRAFGRTRAEVNETILAVAGIKQKTSNRVIYEGARVTTIDTKTSAGTSSINPLYDEVVTGMRGRTGVEYGKEIMTRVGGRPTGDKGSFAGHACDY